MCSIYMYVYSFAYMNKLGNCSVQFIYSAVRFIAVWKPKAGLNIVKYRYNSTHVKAYS